MIGCADELLHRWVWDQLERVEQIVGKFAGLVEADACGCKGTVSLAVGNRQTTRGKACG